MNRRRRRALALAILAAPLLGVGGLALARSGLEAPAPTLLVRDRAGQFLGELPAPGDERLGYWPLPELPARVAAATLALEDRRFARHPGVDPLAIARAFVQNRAAGRRLSGASTIAMQVARLQHPGPRGYLRKGVEAATALALTARHGREALLAHYLRIVPYGHRIHGIAYAARRYLDKPVADLSWAEIAFLAAIPQAPARHDPFTAAGRARAVRRGERILDRLAADGLLDAHDLAVARAEIAHLRLPWQAARPRAALHPLLALESRLPPDARATAPLLTTTLALELQEEVEELAARAVHAAADRGAGNAAVLVVARGSWEVLAAVGSTGYYDAGRAGAIDYLRVPRSSGSTLKPFVYALALERGEISPATILDDLGPGPGGIVNADGRFLGPLLPRTALANSRNVPAVDLLARLGLDRVYGLCGDLGLHDGRLPARRYGLGLAIGSLPVSLERLVGAYTALAGDGRRHELVWLRPRPGQPPPGAPVRLFSEETARLLTLFLADPQARLPTFPRMGATEYPFPVAVKTGTSSRYRDAWTIAWSDRYLVGAWVGDPDERPMSHLSGYRVAAGLVQEVLLHLHGARSDGIGQPDFPAPRGWRRERLCPLSGGRATAACGTAQLEWLPADAPSPPECTAHRLVALDRRTGRPARPGSPDATVEWRSELRLPPRYAGWLAARARPVPEEEAPGTAFLPQLAGVEPRIEVLSPEPGSRLLRDPETPEALRTIALRAVVDPPSPQLVWYLDGRPLATVESPYELRWRLEPGEHVFQARLPFGGARSRLVRVTVE